MIRRAIRQRDASVTLFPFLAVLICTMGSLIVLLVVVVQQARVQANEPRPAPELPAESPAAEPDGVPDELPDEVPLPEAPAGPSREEIETARQQREQFLREIEQLEQSREEKLRRLNEGREELGQLEGNVRQLHEQLAQLEREGQGIAAANQPSSEDFKGRLAELRQSIATAETELNSAREKAERNRSAYAIVPYHGSQQTSRRPVYVECRGDAVILRPEGIHFAASDFRPPFTAGNPLADALRALREYWMAASGNSSEGEPYPLLIVRPDGARAYAACRQALHSWDNEFGYELIPQDMTLAYPDPDPQLTELVRHTVDESRRQREGQRQVRAASPPSVSGFRASRGRGGFVREDGRPVRRAEVNDQTADGTRGVPGMQSPDASDRASGWSPDGEVTETPDSLLGSASGAPSGETTSDQSSAGRVTNTPATVESLARTRGRNWALPNVARDAISITRPLTLNCTADRFELRPEPGSSESPHSVDIETSASEAVQSLVAFIWQRIESWGVAGPGVYWKPVLEVRVGEGGQSRYRELEMLLGDSGLDVIRK